MSSTDILERTAPALTQNASETYHVLVKNTKHGDIHMTSQRHADGTYTHYIPSSRHPRVTYEVTCKDGVFPIRGHCNCPATATCYHIEAALKAERAVSLWIWEIARDMQFSECTEFYIDALDLKERIESGRMEVQA